MGPQEPFSSAGEKLLMCVIILCMLDTILCHLAGCIRASYKLARTLACSFRSLNFDLFTGGLPLSSSRDAPPPTLVTHLCIENYMHACHMCIACDVH